MSVVIKNMEMPPNCFLCNLSYMKGERLFCSVTREEVIRAKRAIECPLVELPPHLSEKNDFWKNEYIKEHDARVEEYKNSVPVVRCAFCEHYIKHDKRCGVWNHGVFKDDYCSRGQKKEEEE